MAKAVQANVYQLKVADARRRGVDPRRHEIAVPSPGTVQEFREALLDRKRIQSYSEFELRIRMHEAWGQWCLFRWYLDADTDGGRQSESGPRCAQAAAVKHAEIHAALWRLRFEQSVRGDAGFRNASAFPRYQAMAGRIPLAVFGKEAATSNDAELLFAACEHVGMLAAIRWIREPTVSWNAPGLAETGDEPFIS